MAEKIDEGKAVTDTLTELKRLHAEATQGPWFQWPYMHGGTVCSQAQTEGDDPLTLADCDMDTRVDYDKQSCANAALIVAAVNALPHLLAVVDAAERALKWIEADELQHGRTFGTGNELRDALAALKGAA